MKVKVIISAFVFSCLLSAVRVYGQDRISSTVEVERDYEGMIINAVKSPVTAEVDDSILNFKLNLDYTTFYNPYRDLYRFSSVLAAKPEVDGTVAYPWLYARLGAAWPLAPSADIYVYPRLGSRFSFGVRFSHDSFWGKVPETVYSGSSVGYSGNKMYGDRMKNSAGAVLGYRWGKGEMSLDADFSDGMYALNNVDGLSHGQIRSYGYVNRFSHFRTNLSVRSENPDPSAFYYDLSLSYRYFGNRSETAEHLADADISLGATLRNAHRLYVRFNGTFSEYGVWAVSPVYRWTGGRWKINAGAVLSSDYGAAIVRNGLHTLLYPDVSVDFEAVKNALWLRAAVSGENRLYSRYDLYGINPWMDRSSDVFLSSTPVSVEFSLKGLVKDRFSYSAAFGYARVNNYLSFMSSGAYQSLAGGASSIFTAGGMLRWKSRDFFALAEVDYRYIQNRAAVLMLPALEASAVFEYNLRQRLYVRADCRFRSKATGMAASSQDSRTALYEIPASVDVGVRVSYAIKPALSVYIEGKNLANSKIQYFMNYVEPGINIGAGICLKL